MANKKYYWLKLQRDFFKRHDIRIIENMPNGKDYILFYLKLLVESIDHEGTLRFSETIPYNEDMLATITNTNVDIVRSAMKVFQELGMVDILEDSTIFMNETNKMLGCETEWAVKKREYRDKERTLSFTCPPVVRQEIEKEKEKDIEIEKDNIGEKSKRFVPPNVEEVQAYCIERGNSVDAQAFVDFYESKGWYVGKNKMKDWKSAVRTWERNRKPNTSNNQSRSLLDELNNCV